ncbi:MAG TPA: hypothetical protein VGC21_00325 [Telluria sp.]
MGIIQRSQRALTTLDARQMNRPATDIEIDINPAKNVIAAKWSNHYFPKYNAGNSINIKGSI